MSLPENRLSRATMIPWVIALVALVSLNALAPGLRQNKKAESFQESGISELSDDLQLRGRSSDPLVYAEPGLGDEVVSAGIPVFLPRVEVQADPPVAKRDGGTVQGRAPPVAHPA